MDWSSIQGRLIWARARAGLGRSEVSDRTGIKVKTIAAHEEGRNLSRGLSIHHSGLYARAYGVSEAWLVAGKGEPIAPPKTDAIRVTVKGRLQAGLWAEAFDAPAEDQFDVWINRRPELEREVLYAAIVRGSSMNQIYPDGSIVVLRRRIEGPFDLIPGKRYHVERQKPDGTVENTLKTVRVRGDGSIWLVPESDDPEFLEAIPADPPRGGHVSFVGRVVQSIVNE